MSVEGYNEIYHKGGEGIFNGMVFVKFNNAFLRERAMERFNSMNVGLNAKRSFMSPDLPIVERVLRSYLFGLKRMLVEWEFQKNSVHVDTNLQTLSVEGKLIVKVEVKDHKLIANWVDEDWRIWRELMEDPKFVQLQVNAQESLDKGKRGASKGKGRSQA